jgi:hypothetical protein
MATAPTKLPNTLHYGGTLNTGTAALGPKPSAGKQFKTQKRFETIVRLENAGFSEAASAAMLCISVPRLRYLKKQPDYLIVRAKLTHGIIIDWDKELSVIKEQRKEILTNALPPALRCLMEELQRPAITLAERRHQTQVAQDLLDREGTFAKISRAEIKPVDHFEFEKYDKASQGIIAALTATAAPPQLDENGDFIAPFGAHTIEAVKANEAFSNSHTLSQTDQEKALAQLEAEALLAGIDLNKPAN